MVYIPLDNILNFSEISFSPPIPLQHFCKLIEICTKNKHFKWSDNMYKQIHCVFIGTPLSPVLANLYMEYFCV